MKKIFFTLLLFLFSRIVLAGSSCSDIPGKQNHAPLKIKDGIVCFMEQPLLDENGEQFADAISVYFIPHKLKPIKADGRGFLYDYDAGKIVDVFELDIDHDGKNEVIVIHFSETRTSHAEPNSSGKFYSVYVFNRTDMGLRLNEHATEWFGSEYSWHSDGNKIVVEYPYLTQRSVRQVVASPFAALITRDEVIPVVVKQKSSLYIPGSYTYTYEKTKKYLIVGDKAIVDKYTVGWCRINYSDGKESLQMWMMCNALEAE